MEKSVRGKNYRKISTQKFKKVVGRASHLSTLKSLLILKAFSIFKKSPDSSINKGW